MYGIQTNLTPVNIETGFENDVKMYGIQTSSVPVLTTTRFENDVKMYGIQTILRLAV